VEKNEEKKIQKFSKTRLEHKNKHQRKQIPGKKEI
jgi:hypothetical protein